MNWKTEIQLIDLGNEQKLEVTCTACGHSRYENIHGLATKLGMAYDYLDEVERNLACYSCRGSVRIALHRHQIPKGLLVGWPKP